jgi:hypothetical protein
MSLSVVYVRETGHVVGGLAVTGVAAPVDVPSLLGTGFPMRITFDSGEVATVTLQPNQLAAGAADDTPAVFADPLSFGVDTVDDKPKPVLVRLARWSEALLLTETTLTVKVPVAVAEDTKVLVMIGADLYLGKISEDKDSTIFQMSLKRGETHAVLVLVAGHAGRFEELSVTP